MANVTLTHSIYSNIYHFTLLVVLVVLCSVLFCHTYACELWLNDTLLILHYTLLQTIIFPVLGNVIVIAALGYFNPTLSPFLIKEVCCSTHV